MITQEQLKDLVHYDPLTGIFTHLKNHKGPARAGSVAGTIGNWGYRHIKLNGKRYTAHRLAWLYMTGEWPSKLLDHVNRMRDDNRWANLRLADFSQNAWNSRMPDRNTSGHKGVYWDPRYKAWLCQFNYKKERQYVGRFRDFQEAVEAIEKRRRELHGEFAAQS